MKPQDHQLCLDAVNTLSHNDHSKKNYLFLEPVDLKYFPTYTEIVKRPMDLGTLRIHLEGGKYRNRDEFYKDAMLCFENALAFHSGNKSTRWIVKLAKDMMKLVSREKKKVCSLAMSLTLLC